MRGHKREIYSLNLLSNRETIASMSIDGSIRLWDALTYKEKAKIHMGYINAVLPGDFSPDGKIMALGTNLFADDNTIRLWDLSFYYKVKDRQLSDGEIEEAERMYNLKLVNLW